MRSPRNLEILFPPELERPALKTGSKINRLTPDLPGPDYDTYQICNIGHDNVIPISSRGIPWNSERKVKIKKDIPLSRKQLLVLIGEADLSNWERF